MTPQEAISDILCIMSQYLEEHDYVLTGHSPINGRLIYKPARDNVMGTSIILAENSLEIWAKHGRGRTKVIEYQDPKLFDDLDEFLKRE